MKSIKSIVILISIVVFMFIAYLISMVFFEPKATNFMINLFTANKSGSAEVVIITIDDKSIAQERWPWKRELYGKIFEYLHEHTEAKVIGFDAIISTPDKDNPDSDKKFYNTIKNIDNLVVGFMPLYTPSPPEDSQNYDKAFNDKFAVKIVDDRTRKYSSSYKSLSKYPKPYFDALKNVGCINATGDHDGYIRRTDILTSYKDSLYPSLALRMYLYLNQNSQVTVTDKFVNVETSGLKIPSMTYITGVVNYIHFYKPLPNSSYSHKTYSAIDIIQSYDDIKAGRKPLIDPTEFEDKVVFVGANAKAAALGLEDARPTPIMGQHPGVDIQATTLDNLLNNDLIYSINLVLDIFILLVLLVATFLIVRYFSLFMSLGILSMVVILYVSICIFCYRFNLYVSVITPIVLQVVTMIFGYSYKFILENQNKEKIKQAMGKFISQDIMQDVVRNIDEVKLGGKKANLTVLFADIRGFTAMSEKLSAQEVSVILNEYFTEIEPIISKHNGIINKFIGDAVMAIFGEPIQDKNHASNAVKCANEMLIKVEQLQEKWLLEGKPKIEIGVGINTGEAFVGNIGSEKRLEYTVIGDMVNLASRIESYNKVYKTNFLISESTYAQVRNIADVIKISEVTIRGKAKKMNIYEVLRLVL